MIDPQFVPRDSKNKYEARKRASYLRLRLVRMSRGSVTRQGLILLAAAFLGTRLWAAVVPNALTLTFHETSIEVRGVTPNATVYLYGMVREPRGFITAVVPHEAKVRDEDGDGSVQLDLGSPFPWRSIWFAVDLESGGFAAGTPDEYVTAKRVELTSSYLKRDAAGEVEELTFDGGIVELIAVRPKTGEVWGASVVSRGGRDKGSVTGKVTFPAIGFDRRAGTANAAPGRLKNGDVIFVMSSFRAEYAAARLGN